MQTTVISLPRRFSLGFDRFLEQKYKKQEYGLAVSFGHSNKGTRVLPHLRGGSGYSIKLYFREGDKDYEKV